MSISLSKTSVKLGFKKCISIFILLEGTGQFLGSASANQVLVAESHDFSQYSTFHDVWSYPKASDSSTTIQVDYLWSNGEKKSFHDAQKVCQNWGGTLAEVHTQEESMYIQSFLIGARSDLQPSPSRSRANQNKNFFWLGSDSVSGPQTEPSDDTDYSVFIRNFEWKSGVSPMVDAFYPGTPNNGWEKKRGKWRQPTEEKCLIASRYEKNNWFFRWDDINCDAEHLFLCEKRIDPDECVPTEDEIHYVFGEDYGLNKATWEEAHVLCTFLGMELPTILSSDQNLYLDDISRERARGRRNEPFWLNSRSVFGPPTREDFIVSLIDRSYALSFYWENGDAVVYSNFDDDEPSNGFKVRGRKRSNEGCLRMDRKGLWQDVPCDKKETIICQQKIRGNDCLSSPTSEPTFVPTDFDEEVVTRLPTLSPTFMPTTSPSVLATANPSMSPITSPTIGPTSYPTFSHPSLSPTFRPSTSPTIDATQAPSASPSLSPSIRPTATPSHKPSLSPSSSPSVAPTVTPSHSPSSRPSVAPTNEPTESPSKSPSNAPTQSPSPRPTFSPSNAPTMIPSESPTLLPTAGPTTSPSRNPSQSPTSSPTLLPSTSPTFSPTIRPALSPSIRPSLSPTRQPSSAPSTSPSVQPSASPSKSPTVSPTVGPTLKPSSSPTFSPSAQPSESPSTSPSMKPSAAPTVSPSLEPTNSPTGSPTMIPSISPTLSPSNGPTIEPTFSPTAGPTVSPSTSPTLIPSTQPSRRPTSSPTIATTPDPTISPSFSPTTTPTESPTGSPTLFPSKLPTVSPTTSPSFSPTQSPSLQPTTYEDSSLLVCGLSALNFANANLVVNNFGGYCGLGAVEGVSCGNGVEKSFTFENITTVSGKEVVLKITNASSYMPFNPSRNGVNGDLLQINVAASSSVEVEFFFMDSTGAPITLRSLGMTVLDLDNSECSCDTLGACGSCGSCTSSTAARESVLVYGNLASSNIENFFLGEGSAATTLCQEDSIDTKFESRQQGFLSDNPTDVENLSDFQKSLSVGIKYVDVETFKLGLGVSNGNNGRNFFITGFSNMFVSECN